MSSNAGQRVDHKVNDQIISTILIGYQSIIDSRSTTITYGKDLCQQSFITAFPYVPKYLHVHTGLAIFYWDSTLWGAADAEIKVPSGENTELKRSAFKAWSKSVYSHTCYACCQGFLPYF